jgi:hypothetical protein
MADEGIMYLFDCMMFDDKVVVNEPYTVRRALINGCVAADTSAKCMAKQFVELGDDWRDQLAVVWKEACGDGGVAGGSTYGLSTDPVLLGSGGGDSSASVGCAGGAGGGLVIISSPAGTLDLNGSIVANGGNPICSAKTGGGGSGGSIKIVSDTLTGSGGLIYAKGGMPVGCTVDCGGSGGGGRIYLQYNSGNHSGLSLSADGGAGVYSGAAGTISTP